MPKKIYKLLQEAIQLGDHQVYERLFHSYYSDLCEYAYGIVHIEEVAEDIVSDLFVKLWEQSEEISIANSIDGYLYRCVKNSCLNYITRKHMLFQELDQDLIDRLNNLFLSLGNIDPAAALITSELQEQIQKAINHLPTECRKVFLMSRNEGLSYKEIAQQLCISENTVNVQIYRALVKLKELLKDYF